MGCGPSAAISPEMLVPFNDCRSWLQGDCTDVCHQRHHDALRIFVEHITRSNPSALSEALLIPIACPYAASFKPCLRQQQCPFFHSQGLASAIHQRKGKQDAHTVWIGWDTENVAASSRTVSAAASVAALSELCELLTGVPASSIIVNAFHGRYLLGRDKTSLRTVGATVVDAGPKSGGVDLALKGAISDLIVEGLMASQRSAAAAGETTRKGFRHRRPSAASASSGGPSRLSHTWIVIVSSDRDFHDDLRRAKRAGARLALVHNSNAPADLLALTDAHLPFSVVMRLAAIKSLAATTAAAGSLTAAEGYGALPLVPIAAGTSPTPFPLNPVEASATLDPSAEGQAPAAYDSSTAASGGSGSERPALLSASGDGQAALSTLGSGGVGSPATTGNGNATPGRRTRVCTYYMNGRCNKGEACVYRHSCPEFERTGACVRGAACRLDHVPVGPPAAAAAASPSPDGLSAPAAAVVLPSISASPATAPTPSSPPLPAVEISGSAASAAAAGATSGSAASAPLMGQASKARAVSGSTGAVKPPKGKKKNGGGIGPGVPAASPVPDRPASATSSTPTRAAPDAAGDRLATIASTAAASGAAEDRSVADAVVSADVSTNTADIPSGRSVAASRSSSASSLGASARSARRPSGADGGIAAAAATNSSVSTDRGGKPPRGGKSGTRGREREGKNGPAGGSGRTSSRSTSPPADRRGTTALQAASLVVGEDDNTGSRTGSRGGHLAPAAPPLSPSGASTVSQGSGWATAASEEGQE